MEPDLAMMAAVDHVSAVAAEADSMATAGKADSAVEEADLAEMVGGGSRFGGGGSRFDGALEMEPEPASCAVDPARPTMLRFHDEAPTDLVAGVLPPARGATTLRRGEGGRRRRARGGRSPVSYAGREEAVR